MRISSSSRFVAVVALAACSEGGSVADAGDPPYVPPPETCTASDLGAPKSFAPCSTGGGIFGAWTLDERGLPAYDYGLDENADPRAGFPDTENLDRRDHLFRFGNRRVTGWFANDGFVEVTTQDRGETFLNVVDETQKAYGGGFSFVDDGTETWATAYKWRPRGARTTRRFGMGYASASTAYRDVIVARSTYAPAGDAPFVIDDVTITNTSKERKTLRHYEYWDVARRPIEIDWIVSGKALSSAPANARAMRDSRNAMFSESVAWDAGARTLGIRRAYVAADPPPDRATPSAVDYYPGDPVLAVLAGEVTRAYVDQATFFGDGDPSSPAALRSHADGEPLDAVDSAPTSAAGQPHMLVLRSDLSLDPGASTTLRFAYGYAPMGEPYAVDASWTDLSRNLRNEATDAVLAHSMYFASDRNPELHRELAWHASQLEASVGWREYWGKHVVPQGSTYLELHGADGAPRDLMLFALPLVYTHPELAREELELTMGLAYADDSRFSYAFQGHGVLDDALGFHTKPSDLDLFFLWALTEYVGATGDTAFLDEPVSYWPIAPENTVTVREHARRAVRHLFDTIGFGPHGLLHVGTGDWSDGIVVNAPNRDLAVADGESVPNSQMALYVLSRAAALFAGDPALVDEIEARRSALATAVKATLGDTFFGRAYFGDGVLFEAGTLDLEAQVWALLAPDLLDDAARSRLVATIETTLDAPSPIGAPLTAGGQVWPAVGQLLTWGYARSDDEAAWSHFARSSLASRARAFPSVWFDVWSGPDGVESKTGQTWASAVTPMTDFPTGNQNVHAMAMLGALKLAGIEASPLGIVVEPHVAGRRFSISTALVDVAQDGGSITGTYRPLGGAPRTVTVRPRATIVSASVNGAAVPVPAGASFVELSVPPGGTFDVESR